MNLTDLKSYLRIDYSTEDTDVQFAYFTAVAYAKEKTGIEYVSGDKLYEQLLKFLTQHFFDNREFMTDKSRVENDFTVTSLIKTIETRGEFIPPVPSEDSGEEADNNSEDVNNNSETVDNSENNNSEVSDNESDNTEEEVNNDEQG